MLRSEISLLAGRPIACECELGTSCHIDVLLALFLEQPTCSFDSVKAYLWTITSVPVPLRPKQWMPQEAFVAAVQSLVPAEWLRGFKFPFIEDIINSSTFSAFAAWKEDQDLQNWRLAPPMAVGTRRAAWRRVAEGRQEGAFLSNRALPQMVPFGLSKCEHFEAAVQWSQSHDIPQERAAMSQPTACHALSTETWLH